MLLNNIRNERYCQFIASGLNKSESYAAAGYTDNGKNAWQLDKKPEIKQRIKEIHDEREKMLAKRDSYKILNKQEAAEILSDMARKSGDMYKRLAITTLARMYGWNEPELIKVRKESDMTDAELEQFIRDSRQGEREEIAPQEDAQSELRIEISSIDDKEGLAGGEKLEKGMSEQCERNTQLTQCNDELSEAKELFEE